MKKVFLKIVGIILSLSLIFGTSVFAFAVESLRLNAVYGDELGDILLPEGYSWSEANPKITPVGDAGSNTFLVKKAVGGISSEISAVVTVAPAYISEVSLQTDGSQYYIGSPEEPEVKLSFKGKELIKNVDYTISFENVDLGKIKVTIEGIGNFCGKTSLNINVEKNDVESVTIDKTKLSMHPREDALLTASVLPSNATFKDVIWYSSDEDIATVDNNGNVHAKRNGEAIITVEAKDGGYKAECEVSVVTNVAEITIPVSKVSLFCKEAYQLKTIITPYNSSNTNLIWASDDESVVKVDENGVLKAVNRGNATVTVTTVDGGYSDTCEVSVHYTWWQAIIWLFLGCLWYFK